MTNMVSVLFCPAKINNTHFPKSMLGIALDISDVPTPSFLYSYMANLNYILLVPDHLCYNGT